MKNLSGLLNKAKKSAFYLWVLNKVLHRAIPFNSPHQLEIIKLTDEEITIKMPFIRRNKNHINGMHACGLATLCEYACGLQLMNITNISEYRIIMKSMEMNYHFQGKADVFATFNLSKAWVEEHIKPALADAESIFRTFEVKVFDGSENHICTAKINWQIKLWAKVKSV